MARRRGGLYLPLDVNFLDDPRIMAIGEKPTYLYLAMLLKAKALLSDGLLTVPQIERLCITGWRQRLKVLVDNELVWPGTDPEATGKPVDSYWITAWFKHNDAADTVIHRRERDAERKRVERETGSVSALGPNLVRQESVTQVERSRDKRSTPCTHGAVDNLLCALCRREQRPA